MSRRLNFMKLKQIRWYSTKEKMKIVDSVNESLLKDEIKHRQHPGIMKPKQIDQPKWLLDTVQTILRDDKIPKKLIFENGINLANHLKGRHAPLEKEELPLKLKAVQSHLQEQTPEDTTDNIDIMKDLKARRLLKTLVYNWAPIHYSKYVGLTYLVSRSVPEYCVLYRIFNEIKGHDPDFKPKSLFDFGSGVGTVMWAASQFWFKSIRDYLCIDTCAEMNELSEYLIKRAKPQILPQYIFYRQYLPTSPTPAYDIVVSAYSLFELSSQQHRLQVLMKLWQKTANYLIVVEQGTTAGFKLVNEARDFILHFKDTTSKGYVLSPCPHDLDCPRLAADNTPCNFALNYLTLPVHEKASYKRELYSYVVIKKGERPGDDCRWPRIVRPTLKRSKHVICRMCTASGELQEQIFTDWKNGKNTYRCARSSEWGDRLPFEIEKPEATE